MAIYNVHGGHSLYCIGAVGIINEVTEDRKVKNKLIELLQAAGHTVYDCTDDVGKTQGDNLASIVAKCNSHSVDLDISIHLNSGRNDCSGDGSTGGVEVYGYNNDVSEVGNKICEEISSTLGIRNRGFKISTDLYVLKRTRSKAILIECAFVDDKDDADRWDAGKCAEAIAKGLGISSQSTISYNNKWNVGDVVSYGTSYPDPTLPCGYEAATGGCGNGKIIAIVNGQAKYQMSTGVYCNDGDIIGRYNEPVYYPKYGGNSGSIADALNSMGYDGSFANRGKIAARNGISNYRGSADQNSKLLSLLKSGKLIKS